MADPAAARKPAHHPAIAVSFLSYGKEYCHAKAATQGCTAGHDLPVRQAMGATPSHIPVPVAAAFTESRHYSRPLFRRIFFTRIKAHCA
ncbi:hypothetical protein V5F31_01345 [Xanthobacter sp. V7C-4]|uniref:hypothetical protein n=1 Tax=Xanthobacter autotrophicus (strain ATCC BAA-1158 / Py2) TaxID=78245 RepID=UPI00372C2C68